MTAPPYPRVDFVATPDTDAQVLYRFHINVGTAYVAHDGFDAGVPEWRGSPRATGATEGYRTLRFSHLIEANYDTAGQALSTLARLLVADDGWLLVQLTEASRPVWFRTWRTTPGGLSLERVRLSETREEVDGKFKIDMSLAADAYAVGARQTLATEVVMNNDPTEFTVFGDLAVLGEVQGDAPAPAVVEVEWGTARGNTYLLQSMSPPADYLSGPTSGTFILEDATADSTVNTGSQVADSLYLGGTYQPTAFPTGPGDVASFTWDDLSTPARQWFIVMRWAPDAVGGSIRARATLTVGTGFGLTGANAVLTASLEANDTDSSQYTVLGVMRIPQTGAPDELLAGASGATYQLAIELLDRDLGTEEINFDAVVMYAWDDKVRSLYVTTTDSDSDGGVPHNVDGEYEAVYLIDAFGNTYPDQFSVAGAFPLLRPGETNVLHLLMGVGVPLGESGADRGIGAEVAVYYRPRWLWVQP